MIKGVTVTLYSKEQTGTDPFGAPVYEEAPDEVKNVLISPVSAEDMVNELSMTGKHIVYLLNIPKGDTHDWTDRRVDFFGEKWKTVGAAQEYMEAMTPTAWNKKVNVERFE